MPAALEDKRARLSSEEVLTIARCPIASAENCLASPLGTTAPGRAHDTPEENLVIHEPSERHRKHGLVALQSLGGLGHGPVQELIVGDGRDHRQVDLVESVAQSLGLRAHR